MDKLNFVPVVNWIKRGVSKELPNKLEISKEELKQLIDSKRNVLIDTENDEEMAESSNESDDNEHNDDIISKYNLDNYDEDSDGELGECSDNLANLTVFARNEDDPYLHNDHHNSDSDSEENENFRINQNDNLVLVGHIEKDASLLEVYVYSEDEDLYVHHDIVLGAYPLCFEWLNYSSNSSDVVNHVAIGDMNKQISIWDMDTVYTLEPVIKLDGHKKAVIDLSWNSILRNILASGSADKSVLLWNLETSQVVTHFNQFKAVVQSLAFHPLEAQTLLIGDTNGVIHIYDCQTNAFKTWNIDNCEIEKVIWNHHNPYSFLSSTSDGHVYYFDCRSKNKPVYSIKAHTDSITGLALSSSCSGCLVTASADKTVKVWDIDENHAEFIYEFSSLNVGSILSLSQCPDLPFVMAVGGDSKSNNFKVIDLSSSKKVSSHFMPRINSKLKNV